MTFTLISLGKEKKDWGVSNVNWSAILGFALINGWQPAGTELPEINLYGEPYSAEDHDKWDGSYEYNFVGQIVSLEDSAAIADALADGFTKDPSELKGNVVKVPFFPDSFLYQEFYTEAGKKYIKEFITFARNGPFYIT